MSTTGPNEQELRKVLQASAAALANASTDWDSGRVALDDVTSELDKGIEGMAEEMGAQTRAAAVASFATMRDRVTEHKRSLRLGRDALDIASDAIDKATQTANTGLPAVNSAPKRQSSDDPASDAVEYARAVRSFDQSVSSREQTAGEALTRLNASLDLSIAKMREARGVPPQDPEPPGVNGPTGAGTSQVGTDPNRQVGTVPGGASGGWGASGTPLPPQGGATGSGQPTPLPPSAGTGNPPPVGPGGTGGPFAPGGLDNPGGPGNPGGPVGPGAGGPDSPAPGSVQAGAPVGGPGGLTGSLTGSLTGAVAGGSALTGALRGLSGLRGVPTGLSESAAAPAAPAPPGSAGSRAAGGVMGRSAGSGSAAGGRAGSRTGRGAGGSMGGRNGAKGKGKGKSRAIDHLVEEDAWLDDEGAGPDVLD